MRTKQLVILPAFMAMAMGVLSCQKPSPGANAAPTDVHILIMQPCWGIKKVGANSTQDVGYKDILTVNTLDNSNNIVQYGTAIVHSYYSSVNNPLITYGHEYTAQVPSAYSYYNSEAMVQTLDCGWPVANYNATLGGKITYKAFQPSTMVAQGYTFSKTSFSTLFTEPCQ